MLNITYIDPNIEWVESIIEFHAQWSHKDPYCTHFSSGSTGKPKEIKVEKKRMIISAQRTNHFFELNKDSKFLLALPCKFIGGRMMLLRAMLLEAKIFAIQPNLNPLMNIPKVLRIDIAAFTPAQLHEILANKISRQNLMNIRKIIIGGAPLSKQLQNEVKQMGLEVYETYGMTETLSHIALKKAGTEYFIPVSSQIKLTTNSDSCLHITDTELLEKDIQTNDVVELNSNGTFIWKGRADFVINSGGLKIHPEELEKEWAQIPELDGRNFYLIGEKEAVFGEIAILKVEGEEILDLMTKIASISPKNKMPKRIEYLKEFRRTENGKIKRE